MNEIKPIGRKLIVEKCTTGTPEVHDGQVYYRVGNVVVTQLRGNHQHWAEILAVSEDCKLFNQETIGCFVWLPEWDPQRMWRVHTSTQDGIPVERFCIREQIFTEGNGKPFLVLPEGKQMPQGFKYED